MWEMLLILDLGRMIPKWMWNQVHREPRLGTFNDGWGWYDMDQKSLWWLWHSEFRNYVSLAQDTDWYDSLSRDDTREEQDNPDSCVSVMLFGNQPKNLVLVVVNLVTVPLWMDREIFSSFVGKAGNWTRMYIKRICKTTVPGWVRSYLVISVRCTFHEELFTLLGNYHVECW